MRKCKQGFIGLQVLVVTATVGVASLFAVPEYQSFEARHAVSEALTFAEELQRRLAQNFEATGRFPTSNKRASTMISSRVSVPEFIRDLRIQPDRTGHSVTIKVFLRDGIAENPTGEVQYVYIAGRRNPEDQGSIKWQCGAVGLVAKLMPEDCGS
jgi:type II secretory pathway pseudopilin PulG